MGDRAAQAWAEGRCWSPGAGARLGREEEAAVPPLVPPPISQEGLWSGCPPPDNTVLWGPLGLEQPQQLPQAREEEMGTAKVPRGSQWRVTAVTSRGSQAPGAGVGASRAALSLSPQWLPSKAGSRAWEPRAVPGAGPA